MGRARRSNDATFTPIGDEATFELIGDATFELVGNPDTPTEEQQEQTVQEMLEEQGIASAEAAFLSGEVKYVISSNVAWIQYIFIDPEQPTSAPINQLMVGYKDGSSYLYEDVPLEVARQFYHADSYGKWVWANLRIRGTVFGFKFNYRLVSGNRVWFNAGKHSQGRHEALKKSGEPFKGYHPEKNWEGAKGRAGAKNAGANLNRKGGSKKVAFFTPAAARFGHINPTGPFKGPSTGVKGLFK